MKIILLLFISTLLFACVNETEILKVLKNHRILNKNQKPETFNSNNSLYNWTNLSKKNITGLL